MAETPTTQKAFYDDKRQFQGKDLGAENKTGGEIREHQVMQSLVVAGIVGLLIFLAFWSRVMKKPAEKLPDPTEVAKKYSGNVYQVDPTMVPKPDKKPAHH